MHFIINFEISSVKFLKSGKNGGDKFLICYFLVINDIYCFIDDHDTWLLLLEYILRFAQVSRVFERLFICYFAVPIALRRKFRKKTHTDQTVFL